MTSKKALSESDICDRFITPAVTRAGWAPNRWRREYGFTDGKIIVRGKLVARAKRKRADYLLFHKPNLPIAPDRGEGQQPLGRLGMQQALAYAETLDVPFVFSSNGDGFLFHDRTGTLATDRAGTRPSTSSRRRTTLWTPTRSGRVSTRSTRIWSPARTTPRPGARKPRYYQQLAINRTVEAIARGQKRLLL